MVWSTKSECGICVNCRFKEGTVWLVKEDIMRAGATGTEGIKSVTPKENVWNRSTARRNHNIDANNGHVHQWVVDLDQAIVCVASNVEHGTG